MSYVFKHFSEQVSGILVAGYTGRNLIGISYVLGQLYLKTIVVETLRILVLHFRKLQIVCCNYARNGKARYFSRKRREPFSLSSELVPFSISSSIINEWRAFLQQSIKLPKRSNSALK